MAKKSLLIIFALGFITVKSDSSSHKCVLENPCLCRTDDGKKLDLSELLKDTSSKFLEDSDRTSNVTYYFHGCHDVLFDPKIYIDPKFASNFTTTAALVRYNASAPVLESIKELGKSSEIVYEKADANSDHYEIVFKDKTNLSASVQLVCNDLSSPFIKIIDVTHNTLLLSSPHACLIDEHHEGMSGASIFFLLIAIAAVIYFIGGALILYVLRGARGMEMIPNVDFWKSLPVKMKNGVIYLLSGCRPTYVTTEESYDRI